MISMMNIIVMVETILKLIVHFTKVIKRICYYVLFFIFIAFTYHIIFELTHGSMSRKTQLKYLDTVLRLSVLQAEHNIFSDFCN